MPKLTKRSVEAIEKGQTIWDSEIKGFNARRLASGVISYGYRYRLNGRQPLMSIGYHGEITTEQARVIAKKLAGQVAAGNDPAAERDASREQAVTDTTKTVNAVLDNYEKRVLDKPHTKGRRKGQPFKSADNIKSVFERLVRPQIGNDIIYDLKRSGIADMLDEIEDSSGPVAAARALAYLRAAFQWQEKRDDDFKMPIAKGMGPGNGVGRDRVLDDAEVRDLWIALDRIDNQAPVCFTRYVRGLLLSAQRRTELGQLHSDQIEGDVWEIAAQDYKNGRAHVIPITAALRAQFVGREGFMFSSDDGVTGFSGFSKPKQLLDDKIAELRAARGAKPMEHWTFHDLRRTARSIMSAYTTSDIAERVIGHAIGGVREIYDKFKYLREKHAALEALANHVLGLVHDTSSARAAAA